MHPLAIWQCGAVDAAAVAMQRMREEGTTEEGKAAARGSSSSSDPILSQFMDQLTRVLMCVGRNNIDDGVTLDKIHMKLK